MTTIRTIVRDGRIRLDEPLDLPEGSEVEVTLRPLNGEMGLTGMTDEEQGDSPEAIARWIAEFEAIPAPIMSDAEWEAWQKRRQEDREWEFAHEEERHQKIMKSLE